MLQHEFESLAGYKVSYNDYVNIIEPMYMAVSLNKEDFVKCINKKRFALRSKSQIVKEMKKISENIQKTCDHYTDSEAWDQLYKLMEELNDRFFGGNGHIMTASTMPDGRGCSFPESIIIYHNSDIEKIELCVPWYKK